jgi:hypothetical protein
MVSSSRFGVWFIALLSVPLALCLVSVAASPVSTLRYVPVNYLWMAWPHLVISTLALSRGGRKPRLLYGLGVLNVLLVAFWVWVRLAVPPQESGIAWLLYFPVGGVGLAGLAGVALGLRAWRSRHRVGA